MYPSSDPDSLVSMLFSVSLRLRDESGDMEGTPPKCLLFRRRRRREIFGESVHSRGKTHLKQLGRGLPISPDVVVEAVSRSVCELIPPHVILTIIK